MSHQIHSVTSDGRDPFKHWTPIEDATLVHRHEGDGWTFRIIAHEIPPRSVKGCRQRYNRLCRRDLSTLELAELGQLWIANKERLFDNVAWLCEVTCLEYERIAFRYAARIPQTPIDEEGGMSAVVICNYRENTSRLWRSLTHGIDGVTWVQAERAWACCQGAFERSD